MTKITCFSDIHGMPNEKLNRWMHENPGDILLYAGDIQFNNYDNGFYTLEWMNSLPFTDKVIIMGNHDSHSEQMMEYAMHLNHFHILENRSIRIKDINIFGSPYSVTFGKWWFMESEEELAKMYAKIPENTNILLTHTPIYGIMDVSTRYENVHAGSKSLLNRVRQLKQLKYHVCGHIHEGHGIQKEGDITFINASITDEHYHLVNDPVVFEYNYD